VHDRTPGSRTISPARADVPRSTAESQEASLWKQEQVNVMVGSFVMVCLFGLIVAMLWLTGAQYRQEFCLLPHDVYAAAVTGLGRAPRCVTTVSTSGSITDLIFDPGRPQPRESSPCRSIPRYPCMSIRSPRSKAKGLTGGTYLEIAGGTAASPILKAQPGQQYPLIASKPSTLQQLAQAGPQLVDRFNTVGERIGDVLNDENRKLIAEIAEVDIGIIDKSAQHHGGIRSSLGGPRCNTGEFAYRERQHRKDARQCRQYPCLGGPRSGVGGPCLEFGRRGDRFAEDDGSQPPIRTVQKIGRLSERHG